MVAAKLPTVARAPRSEFFSFGLPFSFRKEKGSGKGQNYLFSAKGIQRRCLWTPPPFEKGGRKRLLAAERWHEASTFLLVYPFF